MKHRAVIMTLCLHCKSGSRFHNLEIHYGPSKFKIIENNVSKYRGAFKGTCHNVTCAYKEGVSIWYRVKTSIRYRASKIFRKRVGYKFFGIFSTSSGQFNFYLYVIYNGCYEKDVHILLKSRKFFEDLF